MTRAADKGFASIVLPTDVGARLVSSNPTAEQGAWSRASRSQSGSALVRGDAPLVVENVEHSQGSISAVLHTIRGGGSFPVAALVVDTSRWRATRVSLVEFAFPQATEVARPAVSASTLEHLYTLAFRQEADARYCLSSAGDSCDEKQLLSQGEALQQIAARRECALAALPASARAAWPVWRVVTLQPAQGAPGTRAVVGVRVLDQSVPVAGAQVMFSKLPHATCTATTQADGTASCVLADSHGHAGDHPEFEREPVIVTFPGDLRASPIRLPTTRLIPADGG